MVGKSILNAKNVICLCAALVVGAGFVWAEKNKKDDDTDENSSLVQQADTEVKGDENAVAFTEGRLSPAIPELSCRFVRFDDDRAIFVNLDGEYAFVEYGLYPDEMTITSDNGEDIELSSKNGTFSMSFEGTPVSAFVFEGHLISAEGGKLFYDESPVERTVDTFSAYQLSDNCVIECVDKGSYRFRDKDGKIVGITKLSDRSSGEKLEATADGTGFIARDKEGYYYPVLWLNSDVVRTTPEHIIRVNGEELVPMGWNDRYVDPDAKGKNDEPMQPTKPVDYGPVKTDNEGIKELSYEMIEYVNEVRERYGLNPIYGLQTLDDAAAVRAEELTADFSHKRKDDSSFSTVLSELNEWWNCGECIAQTNNTSTYTLFEVLLSSEENRALLLDPKMKYLAASFSEKDGVYYWDVLLYNDTYIDLG